MVAWGKGDKEKIFVILMPFVPYLFNIYCEKVPQSTNLLIPRSFG